MIMHRLASRLLFFLCLLTLPVALMACDSAEEDEDPTISGQWQGTANFQGTPLTVSILLTERDQAITGSGTVTFVNPVAVSVTGTHNYPNVALTIQSSGLEDLNFSGTLTGDARSISGSLSGSGFDNFAITLRKQ